MWLICTADERFTRKGIVPFAEKVATEESRVLVVLFKFERYFVHDVLEVTDFFELLLT